MKHMLSKAVIVVRSKNGMRHATPIGGERLGRTFCGRKTEGWAIDASGPPDCSKCLARSFA
jgi:hypothetical protein